MKITRRDPVEFIKYVLLFIKWNPDSPVGNADGYCPPSLSAGNTIAKSKNSRPKNKMCH